MAKGNNDFVLDTTKSTFQEAIRRVYKEIYFNATYQAPSTSESQPREPLKLPTRKSTTPLRGFRCWEFDGEYLCSFTHNQRWEGPVLRADGPPENRRPDVVRHDPTTQGYHGIYAYRNLNYLFPSGSYDYIYGIIDMGGKVVVHEQGLRGEWCTIKLLYLSLQQLINYPGIVQKLEDRYQCEVTTDAARFLQEGCNGDR